MGEGEPQSPADIATLIVQMATQRDKEAFAKIFRFCAPKLMHFLVTRANGILPHSVLEEVCQEALATTWRDSTGFDPKQHDPIGWLFAIARNIAIEQLHDQMQQSDVVGIFRNGTPAPAPLDDNLDASDRMRRLRNALDRLPQDEASLIRDIYLRGMTHTQIAKARKMPTGTTKAKIRRAMERMRMAMAEAHD